MCVLHTAAPSAATFGPLEMGRSRVISLPMIACQCRMDLFVLCRPCVWHWAALHLLATRVCLAVLSQTNPGRRVVQGPQHFQGKPSALACHRSATARERPTCVQLGMGEAVGSAPVVQRGCKQITPCCPSHQPEPCSFPCLPVCVLCHSVPPRSCPDPTSACPIASHGDGREREGVRERALLGSNWRLLNRGAQHITLVMEINSIVFAF